MDEQPQKRAPNECKLCPNGVIHKIPRDKLLEHVTSHVMEGHSSPIVDCYSCIVRP